MKVIELFEAKMSRNGAILKGGFTLELDRSSSTDIWVLKRMLEDEELAEAVIFHMGFPSMLGDREYLFKLTSNITNNKVSTRIRAGKGTEGMSDSDFTAILRQRLFDWVESHLDDAALGFKK